MPTFNAKKYDARTRHIFNTSSAMVRYLYRLFVQLSKNEIPELQAL
jgi:hypothetical protein